MGRSRKILLIGGLWSLSNFLFAQLRLGTLLELDKVQQVGLSYLLMQSDHAIVELSIYLLLTFLFFYAIVSQFHHARKRGRVLAESFSIFVITLIIQGIVLACSYPGSEVLVGDARVRELDIRFLLLVVLALIAHIALIASVTASVWQRKWHANNFGVHFLLGLPSAALLILFSMPVSVVDLGGASVFVSLWFMSLPLSLSVSCATELRPPYLLRLPVA